MVWRLETKSCVTTQVEQTTRRIAGLTGTGMSVRGLPSRYCSELAPQLSRGLGGGVGAAATGGGGAGGAAAGAGGGASFAGSAQALITVRAATAQRPTPRLTLLCAIRPILPAASRTLWRPPA